MFLDDTQRIQVLKITLKANSSPRLTELLEDAARFTLNYSSIIAQAPLQTYGAALGFSPGNSVIKKLYWNTRLPSIQEITGVQENWDDCLQTLEGQKDWVRAISFSPDCHMLSSASDDHTVRLWDGITGFPIQTFESDEEQITISWSNDSQYLASVSFSGIVQLWHRTTRSQQVFQLERCPVKAIAFSPDCRILALALLHGAIHLWDVNNQTLHATIKGERFPISLDRQSPINLLEQLANVAAEASDQWNANRIEALTFSPDGHVLASASRNGKVYLWNDNTRTRERILEIESAVTAVTFSPDGKTLATGSRDGTIRLWDTNDKTLRMLIEDAYWNGPLCFLPDSQCLVSYNRHMVDFWTTRTGKRQRALTRPTFSSKAIAISPDGRAMATGSMYGPISLWAIVAQDQGCISSDGPALERSSEDATSQLWRATSNTVNHVFGSLSNILNVVATRERSPSSSADSTRSHIEENPHTSNNKYQGSGPKITDISLAPDGQTLATGMSDGTIYLRNTSANAWEAVEKILKGHDQPISSMRFSPDSHNLVSSGKSRETRVWDTSTGDCKLVIQSSTEIASRCSFSPDSSTLGLVSVDNTIGLWNTLNGTCKQILDGHSHTVLHIVFSSDGRFLASASFDQTVRLWEKTDETHEFSSKFVLDDIEYGANAVAISPDNKLLALCAGDQVQVRDVATQSCKWTFNGDPVFFNSITFSPDGDTLATATWSTIRLHDSETGMLKEALGVNPTVRRLSFSFDGQYLNTDRGVLAISHGLSRVSDDKSKPPCLLFVDGDWILHNGKRILWLPPAYRLRDCVVYGSTVILLKDNKLVYLDFDLD